MDTATDTAPIIDTAPVIDTAPTTEVINSPLMIPLETSAMTAEISTSSPINIVLNDYFSVFPTSYLLLIMGIGICITLIYTLYGYLEN
jgi:hypothetical protein